MTAPTRDIALNACTNSTSYTQRGKTAGDNDDRRRLRLSLSTTFRVTSNADSLRPKYIVAKRGSPVLDLVAVRWLILS